MRHATHPFWRCNVCDAQNHESDGECQFCECGGAECKRDNCSDRRHFLACGCVANGRTWGVACESPADHRPQEGGAS